MVVVPGGYGSVSACPSLRVPTIEATPQLSVAVAVPGLTVAVHWGKLLADTLTFGGQVITGGSVPAPLTVNLQPAPAVVVQITVVVPTGKNEPEEGEQTIVPQPPDRKSGLEGKRGDL